MLASDEWWRHDDKDALGVGSRQKSDQSSRAGVQSPVQASSRQSSAQSEIKTSAQEPARQAPSSVSASGLRAESAPQRSGYSLDEEDVVAPWRKNDRTGHLDAMRSKRNSRARRNNQQAHRANYVPTSGPTNTPRREVPQFKDTAARHGGWNIPALNSSKNSLGGTGIITIGNRSFPKRQVITVAVGVVALVLLIFILRGLIGCVSAAFAPQVDSVPATEAATEAATDGAAAPEADTTGSATTQASYTVLDEGRTTASGMGRLSFSAVGDNLMNSNLLTLADKWSGSEGDGAYDFAPFFKEVGAFIRRWVDVSFINQETTLGGTDNFEYVGYPSYNTPDTMADAVANAGWRVVNLNTNHTYDTWVDSIVHSLGVWAQKTSLITIGSYATEAERNTVQMVECNGIRMAMLSYSYGQNGYEQSDLPNTYYAVPYDAETLKADVARAREVADAVVVYLHAGTEYTNEPNNQQKEVAQLCADNGVDVMIGSHAHVIQPVEWIERADGSGKMLCVYGLGDFVSGYTGYPETILSGMITFDFVRVDSADTAEQGGDDAEAASAEVATTGAAETANVGPGGIAVENVVWHPLIEHMVGDTDVVRFVSGYSSEDARANELLATLDDPLTWIKETTQSVIGDAVTIDM